MLKTNLSTRPFYNERRIHVLAAIAAVAVIGFTAWNLGSLIGLSEKRAALREQVAADEQAAVDLRGRAAALERGVDRVALAAVAEQARHANGIIEGRLFSWTEFFNRLEETLPAGVRLVSVAPQLDEADNGVTLIVIARRGEDADEFMERLEASGAFSGMSPVSDFVTDDGEHRVMLRGRYFPRAADGTQTSDEDEAGSDVREGAEVRP